MDNNELLTSASTFANWMLAKNAWENCHQSLGIMARLHRSMDLVVVAGANMGMESYLFATAFSRIVMFEPLEEYVRLISDNFVTANRSNWEIHGLALGDRMEIKPFTKLYWQDSLTPDVLSGFELQSKDFPDYRRVETPIQVMPLDHYALAPSLIQMDVEGYEFQVLSGAIETIHGHRPVLQLEGVFPNVEQLLKELDYIEIEPWFKVTDRYFCHSSDWFNQHKSTF